MTATQSRGRIFFICALLLLAEMQFGPAVSSLASGELDMGGSILSSIIGILLLVAAFRGGVLSLTIIKGCLGILAVIMILTVILVGIEVSMRQLPPPKIEWDGLTLSNFASALSLFYIYWALFFSKSVKEFIIHQRERFHAREMRKIQESIGRTDPRSNR